MMGIEPAYKVVQRLTCGNEGTNKVLSGGNQGRLGRLQKTKIGSLGHAVTIFDAPSLLVEARTFLIWHLLRIGRQLA